MVLPGAGVAWLGVVLGDVALVGPLSQGSAVCVSTAVSGLQPSSVEACPHLYVIAALRSPLFIQLAVW